MSTEALREIARRLVYYTIVTRVEFLRTKVRAYIIGEYILDVYYNQTLGKYSYTLIKENKRIIGWDNAPHHISIKSYPHHFHDADGKIMKSQLSGDPLKDLDIIMRAIKKFSKLRK
nr:DUF6516 family protein [Candidatus Freyarchaeota archaeon]